MSQCCTPSGAITDLWPITSGAVTRGGDTRQSSGSTVAVFQHSSFTPYSFTLKLVGIVRCDLDITALQAVPVNNIATIDVAMTALDVLRISSCSRRREASSAGNPECAYK